MARPIFALVAALLLLMAWTVLTSEDKAAIAGVAKPQEDVTRPGESSAQLVAPGGEPARVAMTLDGATPQPQGAPSADTSSEISAAIEAAGLIVRELGSSTLIEGATAIEGVMNGLAREHGAEPLAGPSGTDGRLAVTMTEAKPGRRPTRTITIKAPGYGQVAVLVGPQHVPPGDPVEVYLQRGGTLTGTVAVVEGEVGYTADELRVVFTARLGEIAQPQWSLSFGGDVDWTVDVAVDGSFTVQDVAPNKRLKAAIYRGDVMIWKSPEKVLVGVGETVALRWTVGGGSTVRVRAVEASGGPAAGLEVMLDTPPQRGIRYYRSKTELARIATTDAAGECSFDKVTPGPWSLTITQAQPRKDLPEASPSVERFQVSAGLEVVDLNVTVHRGLFISGKVLTWNGQTSKTSVQAIGMGDDGGSMLSDFLEDGGFRIGPLLPGGFTLFAGSMGNGENAVSRPVSAKAGDSGVVVQLRHGGTVAGKVVDRLTGKPIGAQVGYRPIPAQRGGYTATVDSGAFDLGSVLPGQFQLLVTASDGRKAATEILEMSPGGALTDLVIEIGASTFLDVHYVGDHPRVYVGAYRGDSQVSGEWIRSGESARLAVAPGSCSVKASIVGGESDGREWSVVEARELLVIEGQALRVDMTGQ